MEIGIIGFGRFGKLAAEHLSRDFKVYVYSRSGKAKDIKKLNLRPASLEEACKKDIVIPCVPISKFEEVIKGICHKLQKGALVADICSVKEYPMGVMKKFLPDEINILGTHPLFGPDTVSDKLEGRKIFLSKVRIPDDYYSRIKEFLIKKGLVVIEGDAAEHDRETAKSLMLVHFISRALMEFGAKEQKIDTEGYKRLLSILEIVRKDSWQLFEDMNRFNKYSKRAREDFIKALESVNKRIEK